MQNPSIETMLADDRFVRRVARRLVRDGPTADDLTQAAYVEALEHAPSTGEASRGWIATVVRHLASNLRRGDERRVRHERAAARSEAQAPESVLVEREEVRRRLVAAVLHLRTPRSTVVILRYFEDLPPRAIARRLDMPVETVRTHLKRAHVELRARLGSERRSDGSSVFAALPLLLPAPQVGPFAIGVALMTAKTKVALFVLAAVLAALAWRVVRPQAPAAAQPNALQSQSETSVERPLAEQAALSAPSALVTERSPLAAQPADPASAPKPGVSNTGILRGLVLDPEGAPVAGASVQGNVSGAKGKDRSIDEETLLRRLMRGETGVVDEVLRADSSFQARSRADGSFEVAGIPQGDSYDVAAWSPALGVVVVAGVPVRADQPATVTLRFADGVVLRGVITNEAGAPVRGANVQVMGTKDGNSYSGLLFVEAAEDGSWSTPPLARSAFHVTASAPGFQSDRRHLTWDPQHEHEIRVVFHLAPAPVLRGRFVDADGAPARLSAAFEARGFETHGSQIELLGSYDDPALDPNFRDIGHDDGTIEWGEDRWSLTLNDSEPRYVSLWCGNTMLGVVQPVPGSDADLVVHFERLRAPMPRAVVVRIVDEQRAAVSGAAVRLRPGPGQPGGRRVIVQSLAAEPGSAGVLRVEGILPGEYELRVTAPGFVPRRVPLAVDEGPGAVEANVTLALASQRVSVVARTSNGEPVAGARIFVLDADGQPVDSTDPATTNLEGRVELAGLGAGECTILATHEHLAAAGQRVRIDAGLREVELTLAEAVEVRVDAQGSDGPVSFRVSDAAGVVVFEDLCIETWRYGAGFTLRLPPGRHTVVARCPGFAPGEATVDVAPGARVVIPLVPLPR
ncbi:MAG: sigma-70 family RNA polymerase sigma factor [Planctomycetota bacterium]|nr:sigma-70 family RNA polymerase sigma factor [Planctomycetota bacterium]